MTPRRSIPAVAALLALGIPAAGPAKAEAAPPIELTIKDHRFRPDRIEVPAGREFVLLIRNLDPTPEEFDSHDLHREKVIRGGGEAKVRIGSLKPGEYRFVGEFHEDTAEGVIVAR